MVEISGIYTIRDTPQPYYWDIVFEWEDQFSKSLNVPLIKVGEKYDRIYKPSFIHKVLNRINFFKWRDKLFYKPNKFYLAFHIGPPGIYSFYSRIDVIPLIIDFWKNENLNRFEHIFSSSKAVFISSKEVYEYLRLKNLKINLEHLALSLPDRLVDINTTLKDIDIIQLGRQNKILNTYVNQYLQKYPETNYVYSEKVAGNACLISSKKGRIEDKGDRDFFIKILKRSKVSLLSAPGMDNDFARTGGFSPVTPRFLESAACNCFMLGIYPENSDFEYFKIDSVCYKVKDYQSFEDTVNVYLNKEVIPSYTDFINDNLSSTRANELTIKLNKL